MIKPKKLPAFIIFFAVFLVITVVIFKFDLFTIKQLDINLSGVDCADPAKLQSDLNLVGKNIFLADYETAAKSLQSKYYCIDEVLFDKQFKTVKVTFNNRIPVARIGVYQKTQVWSLENMEATPSSSAALLDWKIEGGGKMYLIDKNGLVFSEKDENYPRLYISDQTLKLGRQMDNQLFGNIALIFDKLTQMGIVGFDSKIDGIDLLINSQPKIVFNLGGDLKRQIASLQLILQKAKIDSKTVEIIDLRFDKPVIMYTSKTSQNTKEIQATSSR